VGDLREREAVEVWRREALEFAPSWAKGIYRPRIVIKRGRWSPWWLPPVWLTPTGVFTTFCVIAVSEDVLYCDAGYRRAALAHEVGHLAGLHSLLWVILIMALFHGPFPELAAWTREQFGPWGPVGAFSILMTVGIYAVRGVLVWFEHEADDYAVARVGMTEFTTGLRWMKQRIVGDRPAPWVEERLARLAGMAKGPREAGSSS